MRRDSVTDAEEIGIQLAEKFPVWTPDGALQPTCAVL